MKLKTNSIVDIVESTINKNINDIQLDELNIIKNLRVCKIDYNDILDIDLNELRHFNNLEELSIEGCMINHDDLTILKELSNLKKISFIDCDFIDNSQEYFDNLCVEELVLNNVIGLDGILFSNINMLTIINIILNCSVENIKNIDISKNSLLNIDLIKLDINNLIINKKQLTEEYLKLPYNIIIKNEYDEIIQVINHDQT
jgi:hypothetical protein